MIDIHYLVVQNVMLTLLCLFFLIYMRHVISDGNNSAFRSELKLYMLIAIVSISADMGYCICSTQQAFSGKVLCLIFSFVSVLLTTVAGYSWNRCFDLLFDTAKQRLYLKLYCIPVALTAIMLSLNIPTGLFFSVAGPSGDMRGNLYFLAFLTEYSGFALLSLRALLYRKNLSTVKRIKNRYGMILMGIIALAFGLVQWHTNSIITVSSMGITAGLFIFYSRFLDNQITKDRLTGINNRYALDAHIVDKTQSYSAVVHGGKSLYLVLMDVNRFKLINDRFGHMEGDKTLCLVSKMLKQIGKKYSTSLFLSRFGGDEFAAVYEAKSESELVALCEEIKDTVSSAGRHLAYPLSLSVGYAKYQGKEMSIEALYALADAELYKDKNTANTNEISAK